MKVIQKSSVSFVIYKPLLSRQEAMKDRTHRTRITMTNYLHDWRVGYLDDSPPFEKLKHHTKLISNEKERTQKIKKERSRKDEAHARQVSRSA